MKKLINFYLCCFLSLFISSCEQKKVKLQYPSYTIEFIKISKWEHTKYYAIYVLCNITNNSDNDKLLRVRECYDFPFFTGYTNNDTIIFHTYGIHQDIMSVKRKEQIALIALSHIPNQTDSLFVNDIKTLKIKYVAPLYVHSLNGFMDSLSILQTDSTKFTVLPNNVSLDVEEVGKPHPFPMK